MGGILRCAATLWLLLGVADLGWAGAAASQVEAPSVLTLTIEEAVRLALERNPSALASRLDVRDSEQEVAIALGERGLRLQSSASYTREIASPNPFAGTDVAGLFGLGAPTDWLLFNERARTDGDPATSPLPLSEFQRRQERAFAEAGIDRHGEAANPFAVPNRFRAGVSLSHSVLDPVGRANVRAARLLRDAAEVGVMRQAAATADTVRRAYLGALLASARAEVMERSVSRAAADAATAASQVEAGLAPVTHRLVAEVELANLRAELATGRAEAEASRERLALTLDLPDRRIVLADPLAVDDDFAAAALDEELLLESVLRERPEILEARLAIAAREAGIEAARAARRPSVSAFAEIAYLGNVPGDRSRVRSDPLQPFAPELERRSLLSDDFWNLSADAGVRMTWNAFAGGALRAREERARINAEQARLRLRAVEGAATVEARSRLRDVRAGRERSGLQAENVRLAERSYEIVRARVGQGLATALELREASGQLDRARLGLLQAVHDYRAARSRILALSGIVYARDAPAGFR